MTKAARDRQNSTGPGSRWYEATDPSLPPDERERRARAAQDAHMSKMRLARSVARRKAAEQAARADQLSREIDDVAAAQ